MQILIYHLWFNDWVMLPFLSILSGTNESRLHHPSMEHPWVHTRLSSCWALLWQPSDSPGDGPVWPQCQGCFAFHRQHNHLVGVPSAIASWPSRPTLLGDANQLDTLSCQSLGWSQHALIATAHTLSIKCHWILSGDGNRNCSEVPCSPPTVQTPCLSSSQPAPWPWLSTSCSVCAKPRLHHWSPGTSQVPKTLLQLRLPGNAQGPSLGSHGRSQNSKLGGYVKTTMIPNWN